MGNDLLQYRSAIGSYEFAKKFKKKRTGGARCMQKCNIVFKCHSGELSMSGIYILYVLFLSYLVPIMLQMFIDTSSEIKNNVPIYFNYTLSHYINITMLFLSVLRASIEVTLLHLDKVQFKKSVVRRFLHDPVSKKLNLFKCLSNMITTFTVTVCFGLSCLNLTLLTICNMSIINPGPSVSGIKLFYLNIQGLATQNTLGTSAVVTLL